MKTKKKRPKNVVKLTRREQKKLKDIVNKGKSGARVIKRARVLIKTDQGVPDKKISEQAEVPMRTIRRIRKRYVTGGLTKALYEDPRSGQPRKLDDKAEAHLVAIACSDSPEGRTHWTLELLQEQMIKDKKVKTISTVALWQYLNNRGIKPWLEKNVVRTGSERGVQEKNGGCTGNLPKTV